MAAVHWTDLAEQDLEEIVFWIAVHEGKFETADRVCRAIRSACERCADYPLSGTVRPDIGEGYRLLSLERWIIAFRPLDNGIEVMHVLDGSRDLDSLL